MGQPAYAMWLLEMVSLNVDAPALDEYPSHAGVRVTGNGTSPATVQAINAGDHHEQHTDEQ